MVNNEWPAQLSDLIDRDEPKIGGMDVVERGRIAAMSSGRFAARAFARRRLQWRREG